MKRRFLLVVAALLTLIAGCAAQDGSDNVAQPAAKTATPTPVVRTTPTEASAPTDNAASPAEERVNNNPLPELVGPEPVAGVNADYVVIEGGQPYQAMEGKIEVAEIFGYTCPACARSQLATAPWLERQPADVNVVLIPASFGGVWDDYARAFFAAQALTILEASHQDLYAAIHVQRSLKGERNGGDSVAEIAQFYAQYGIDPQQFIETMNSFAVVTHTGKAKQFIQSHRINSTPSLLVAGKYLVMGKSFEDRLRIADHLIARERAARD